MKTSENLIIGELLTKEKYKLIDSRLVAEVVRDTFEYLNEPCKSANPLLSILTRLTEKIARANNIQHSGGKISAEDWAELYQINNDAKAAINKAGRAAIRKATAE